MTFSLTTVTNQVVSILNAGVRDSSGNSTYSSSLGDKTWNSSEITRAAQSAVTRIMNAICETDGHSVRNLWTASVSLTNGANLPTHYGSIGQPRITPYSGCTYKVIGKRKSVEEVQAYRDNPGKLYSATAHDARKGAHPSKLAGFYALDSGTFYFTGSSAEADITTFTESDYTLLPDTYYPLAIDGAIGYLIKDGTVSEIFSAYATRFEQGIQNIMAQAQTEPSNNPVRGDRDSGTR